jgi:hypothetical protein
MSVIQILREFLHDKQVATVGALLVADRVFGVLAAFKTRTFDITKIGNLLRDDVLAKVLPWLAVFAFAKVQPGDFVAGVNLSTISDTVFVGICAQMGGSLLNSFQDLGFPIPPQLARFGVGRHAQWNTAVIVDQGDRDPQAS